MRQDAPRQVQRQRIFLASSAELLEDRRTFEIFVDRQNKRWHERGLFLELVIWEDFIDAMSATRLQDEYNRAIQQCDLFVMLFWTKVGLYTAEEFETAFQQFKATGRPLVYTYFKDASAPDGRVDDDDMASLYGFKSKLKKLGHFYTSYANTDALCRQFGEQLEKLALAGFFSVTPGPETAASRAAAEPSYRAELQGSGAIAQGQGATALGAGAVQVVGHNSGTIVTGGVQTGGGAFFTGPVSAQKVIGRDQVVHHAPPAAAPPDLGWQTLLAALAAQVHAQAPEAQRAEAGRTVELLATEVAKGGQAEDSKLAHLVKGLIDLVPAAVGGVLSTFATPVLGALAGPATMAVLERLGMK